MIVLNFALPTSYSVDGTSDVYVNLFMGTLAGAMPVIFADVNANALVVAMTALEFPVSTPLEEFSR